MNIVDKILVDPITRGLKFFTKGGVPAYITQVRGRTDGSAAAAGEIGEVRTTGAQNIAMSATAGVVTNITNAVLASVPAGSWLFILQADIGGSVINPGYLCISQFSGTTNTDVVEGDNLLSYSAPTAAGAANTTIVYPLVLGTPTTMYGKFQCTVTQATAVIRYTFRAVRIA
jgi:hypothetical protein